MATNEILIKAEEPILKIEEHITHTMEVHTHGNPVSRVVVECTTCGVEVAVLYDANDFLSDSEYYDAVVSANSESGSTFAVVHLHEDTVRELLEIADDLDDLRERESHLKMLAVDSFNVSVVGFRKMDSEDPVRLKDYDQISTNRDDWDWLHQDVLTTHPPDDFVYRIGHDDWLRLRTFSGIGVVNEIRCVATTNGVFWELEVCITDDHVEAFYTATVPWKTLEMFMDLQDAQD